MKLSRLISIIAFTVCFFSFLQAQPNWDWAVRSGSGLDDYGQKVVTDAQGNIYHIGYFSGTVQFGNTSLSSSGGTDIYVARVGANGIWHWAVKAGGYYNDYGRDITIDSAGYLCITGDYIGNATFGSTTLTGTSYGNIFVAKLDIYGQWIWANGVTCSGYAYSYGIATDGSNSIYITGAFSNTIAWGFYTTSGNDLDIFTAKLNASGVGWVWTRNAGGYYPDYAYDITLDDSGYVYITGSFSGTANFGTTQMTALGNSDLFVSKISASTASWIWSRRGGQTAYTVSNTICVSGSYLVIAGEFNGIITIGSTSVSTSGNYDAFVALIGSDGTWGWMIRTFGSNDEKISSIAAGESGFVYAAGYFAGNATIGTYNHSSLGYYDLFVARIHLSGFWLESVRAGGSAPDYAYGITLDKAGYIYVTGAFQGTCTFRSGVSVSSYGGHDIFLARYGSFIPPEPVIYLFPFAGSTGLPRKVTLSWRFEKGDKPAPTVFKIYMNYSYMTSVTYTGDGYYNLPFGPNPYGYAANWRVVPSNNGVEDTNLPYRSFAVMSQPADEDIPALPTQAVYTESAPYTGSAGVGMSPPLIDLGWGSISTYCSFVPSSPVTAHVFSILLMDKSLNQMPNPSACLASLQLGLPQNIQTSVTFGYQGTAVPDELVWWDGSQWNDITAGSGAVFTQNSGWVYVTFSFTSSGRGVEEFAVNNGSDTTLPVVLSSFTAVPAQNNYVQLNWVTQSETNVLGFKLYRNTTEQLSEALNLNVLISATNTSTEQHYSYLDEDVSGSGTYYYWLESCDLDGQFRFYGPVSVAISDSPGDPLVPPVVTSDLLHLYPNPFTPRLFVSVDHKDDGILSVFVYDVLGRKVAALSDGYSAKGMKSLVWNGKDDNNADCASGIYFIHCRTGKEQCVGKAILLK